MRNADHAGRFRPPSRARGYSTAWDKESRAFLRANPLCKHCHQRGKTRASEMTDHIKPAKHFPELFMDPNNWQALCWTCHAIKTKADRKRYGE